MPEQIYTTLKLEPSKQQIDIYKRLKDDFVIAIEQATRAGDTEIKSKMAKNAAAKFIAMQQVSSGFFYADKEREEDKRGELIILNDDRATYIAEELIQGEKTVVFARFHASLDALKRAFDANGIKAVELSGRRTAQENDDAKDAFLNDDETLVLYATAASGGTGLNLQRSSKIIFMENSFSYGDRVQAEARIWRVGQRNHCRYYDIVQFPIDKLVLANLQKKQDLSSQLQSLAALKEFAGEL
jgi:SNF2 family DNA or RNA helicase